MNTGVIFIHEYWMLLALLAIGFAPLAWACWVLCRLAADDQTAYEQARDIDPDCAWDNAVGQQRGNARERARTLLFRRRRNRDARSVL